MKFNYFFLLNLFVLSLSAEAQVKPSVKAKRYTVILRVVTAAVDDTAAGTRKGVGYQEIMQNGKLSAVRKVSLTIQSSGDPNRTCINSLTRALENKAMFHITGDGTMATDGARDLYTITSAAECDELMPPIEL